MSLKALLILIPLLPLIAAVVAGLFRNVIGRAGSHWVTILGVGASFFLSAYVLYLQIYGGLGLSLIHISEPTRQPATSRMPASA